MTAALVVTLAGVVVLALCWFKGNPYRPVKMSDELTTYHERTIREREQSGEEEG